MPIYERFTGKHREDYKTLEELRSSFKLTSNDDFNFA